MQFHPSFSLFHRKKRWPKNTINQRQVGLGTFLIFKIVSSTFSNEDHVCSFQDSSFQNNSLKNDCLWIFKSYRSLTLKGRLNNGRWLILYKVDYYKNRKFMSKGWVAINMQKRSFQKPFVRYPTIFHRSCL